MDEQRALKTLVLTEVNQNFLRFASLSPARRSEWEFFCECGRPDCREYVVLTLEAYAAIHDSGGSVLAEGHTPSQVERARELRLDAEALRRQAEHQIRRSERNLRDIAPDTP